MGGFFDLTGNSIRILEKKKDALEIFSIDRMFSHKLY